MSSHPRELHLNLNFLNAGTLGSAWRWPGVDPGSFADMDFHVRVAQLAERGTFDAVFLADFLGISGRPEFGPFQALEPTVTLAVMSAHTRHIGLIGTISSTFSHPFNIARRIASLEQASGGRSGINIVTSGDKVSAWNFGLSGPVSHSERYERADEFTRVIKALWNSWEHDALIGDKVSGRFLDPGKIHALDFTGRYFSVKGPLNVPRSPQGRPVIIQAGGSGEGRDFAARHADAVFSLAHTLEEAHSYERSLSESLSAAGRSRSDILIFPGLVTIIGSTEEEAKKREQEIWDLVPPELGLARLADTLGVSPRSLDLDKPLPPDLPMPKDGIQTFFKGATTLARDNQWTVRDLLRHQRGGTHHRVIVGSPEQIADSIECWFLSGAVDGFNIMPDILPSGLETFVDHVVPELRRRGIFRTEYRGTTLREHLSLPPILKGGRTPRSGDRGGSDD